MADATAVHRKYLKAAVGALCLEKGYDSITKLAIETLTEMIQSCKFWSFITCFYKCIVYWNM